MCLGCKKLTKKIKKKKCAYEHLLQYVLNMKHYKVIVCYFVRINYLLGYGFSLKKVYDNGELYGFHTFLFPLVIHFLR